MSVAAPGGGLCTHYCVASGDMSWEAMPSIHSDFTLVILLKLLKRVSAFSYDFYP